MIKIFKEICRYIILSLGILLIILGLYLSFITTLNLCTILDILAGVFLCCASISYEYIVEHSKKGFFKYLRYVTLMFLMFMVTVIIFIFAVGQSNNTDYKEDAIIVLGAGLVGDKPTSSLKNRLDGAIKYLKINPDAIVIVSGGQGNNELISEADAMKSYLISNGICDDKIITEDKSTSTYKNFIYSKALLDEFFNTSTYTTVYCTNNFHAYRAGELAEIAGLSSNRYSSEIDWYIAPGVYLREFLAVVKLWLFNK